MKIFAVLAFASLAAAATLDQSGLLPPHAESAGGSNDDLQAPYNTERQDYQDYNNREPEGGGYQDGGYPVESYQGGGFRGRSNNVQGDILKYENELNQEGYHYAYETSDGTKVEQTGRIYPGSEPETGSLSVTGSYSYIGDDGQEYTVTYIADENGYRAEGAHLPKSASPAKYLTVNSLELSDTRGQYDSTKSSYDADAGL